MTDPQIISPNSLHGQAIAVSVSDSADLARLGLTALHCKLAVAELGRAIILAGGSIIYGGNLAAKGFTPILIDEVLKFAPSPDVLTICLAESVHATTTPKRRRKVQDQLGTLGRVVCLDSEGAPIDGPLARARNHSDAGSALTAMRSYVADHSSARVIVGGSLETYSGVMPGVIEEAIASLRRRQPLYVAGGFGGAALAVARALGHESPDGWPPDLPAGLNKVADHLSDLKVMAEAGLADDGLSDADRRQLAVTHRPGEIAAHVVRGLSLRA